MFSRFDLPTFLCHLDELLSNSLRSCFTLFFAYQQKKAQKVLKTAFLCEILFSFFFQPSISFLQVPHFQVFSSKILQNRDFSKRAKSIMLFKSEAMKPDIHIVLPNFHKLFSVC